MADIEWPDVTAFASELSGVASAAQTTILAYVNTKLKSVYFGGDDSVEYTLARIYLAAHLGTAALPGQGGTSGQVTAEAAGGLSRSYSVAPIPPLSGQDWDLTGYGKKFKAMLMRSGARGGFAA